MISFLSVFSYLFESQSHRERKKELQDKRVIFYPLAHYPDVNSDRAGQSGSQELGYSSWLPRGWQRHEHPGHHPLLYPSKAGSCVRSRTARTWKSFHIWFHGVNIFSFSLSLVEASLTPDFRVDCSLSSRWPHLLQGYETLKFLTVVYRNKIRWRHASLWEGPCHGRDRCLECQHPGPVNP